jgi:hypothetical protein
MVRKAKNFAECLVAKRNYFTFVTDQIYNHAIITE